MGLVNKASAISSRMSARRDHEIHLMMQLTRTVQKRSNSRRRVQYDEDEVMLALTDTYMNTIDLSVVFGELSGKIFILENDVVRAVVRDTGIVNDL
ncbi:MAG: hypothetical protein EZS28_005633 [Streblomastix strix]|uniref:Uncharacterized protein n=1 Tax=Streblomastix strix TaxID=222440 RepID=A0A5J4WV86_9EUKA|nr:MAG: hypothetical protein EZS28_005633 [Streblomastix strix]